MTSHVAGVRFKRSQLVSIVVVSRTWDLKLWKRRQHQNLGPPHFSDHSPEGLQMAL